MTNSELLTNGPASVFHIDDPVLRSESIYKPQSFISTFTCKDELGLDVTGRVESLWIDGSKASGGTDLRSQNFELVRGVQIKTQESAPHEFYDEQDRIQAQQVQGFSCEIPDPKSGETLVFRIQSGKLTSLDFDGIRIRNETRLQVTIKDSAGEFHSVDDPQLDQSKAAYINGIVGQYNNGTSNSRKLRLPFDEDGNLQGFISQ
ncbi:hypothetical protein JW887_05645 [Candidatus Dojkabacteria bacterium]|nr:hypothetical protein [Candidatus Dojkabacteria bacterium]